MPKMKVRLINHSSKEQQKKTNSWILAINLLHG
jgi:hypothetical protein